MSNEENFMKAIEWANYFTLVLSMPALDGNSEVLHLVGYATEPSEDDLNSLENELKTDKEFGLCHLTRGEDYFMMSLTKEEYLKILQSENSNDPSLSDTNL